MSSFRCGKCGVSDQLANVATYVPADQWVKGPRIAPSGGPDGSAKLSDTWNASIRLGRDFLDHAVVVGVAIPAHLRLKCRVCGDQTTCSLQAGAE